MIRDLYGVRVVFIRFHDASHVIVEVNGEERVLKKSVWASLPGPQEVPAPWHDGKHEKRSV